MPIDIYGRLRLDKPFRKGTVGVLVRIGWMRQVGRWGFDKLARLSGLFICSLILTCLCSFLLRPEIGFETSLSL